LEDPAFIAYLDYLQYFARPEYVKFLMCVVFPDYPPPSPFGKSLQQIKHEEKGREKKEKKKGKKKKRLGSDTVG
jgi:hypothetical protein